MNRRQFLGLSAGAMCTSLTYADCRDENRIPQPHDLAVEKCLELDVRSSINGDRSVARATFTFGMYEELLRYKGDWFLFEFGGRRHRIRVAHISVDVNRQFGCVVVDVQGLYMCER